MPVCQRQPAEWCAVLCQPQLWQHTAGKPRGVPLDVPGPAARQRRPVAGSRNSLSTLHSWKSLKSAFPRQNHQHRWFRTPAARTQEHGRATQPMPPPAHAAPRGWRQAEAEERWMAMSVAGSPAIVATLLQHNLHRQEPTAAPCQSAARPERSPAVGGVDTTRSGSFCNAERCCSSSSAGIRPYRRHRGQHAASGAVAYQAAAEPCRSARRRGSSAPASTRTSYTNDTHRSRASGAAPPRPARLDRRSSRGAVESQV